jgi:hypothetical protein
MSKWLRILFLVHAVVAAIVGLALLLAPGRTMDLLGLPPIDAVLNVVSRILGAALLAMAWSSLRCWRAATRSQAAILVEVEAIFTVLTCISLLRLLLSANWPWYDWALLGVFVAFALAWLVALLEVARTPKT